MTKQYTNEEIKEQTQAAVKRIFGDSLGFLDFNEPSRNHVYGSTGEQTLCESIYTPLTVKCLPSIIFNKQEAICH